MAFDLSVNSFKSWLKDKGNEPVSLVAEPNPVWVWILDRGPVEADGDDATISIQWVGGEDFEEYPTPNWVNHLNTTYEYEPGMTGLEVLKMVEEAGYL